MNARSLGTRVALVVAALVGLAVVAQFAGGSIMTALRHAHGMH